MSRPKREPRVIDVKPEELHREAPGELDTSRYPPRTLRAHPLPAAHQLTPRQARELRAMGRAAQDPAFWIGVAIRAFWR